MRFLIFIVFFSSYLFSITFNDFVFLSGKVSNKSVFIASDFDPKIDVDIDNTNTIDYISILENLSDFYDFNLKITDNEIYISQKFYFDENLTYNSKSSTGINFSSGNSSAIIFDVNRTIDEDKDYKYFVYVLSYLNKLDIDRMFNIVNVKYEYIENINSIIVRYENDEELFNVINILKSIDVNREQVLIKFYIFESSKDTNLEFGLNSSVFASFDLNHKRDFASNLNNDKSIVSLGFSGALKLLEADGNVSISNNPSFLLSNRQKLDFGSTITIPYKLENYSISGNNPILNNSNRYDYKEVGFKISIIPTIVKDSVYLDFDLVFDDVVSNIDNLPVTAGKRINNSFFLNKGDVMLIAGIEKKSETISATGVPFLRSIPFIGSLFGTRAKRSKFDRFNIAVEFIEVVNVRS